MALGGFLCPFCRYYNANDAGVCASCERRLPPPGMASALATVLSVELWATKLLAGVSIAVFALELASAGGKLDLGLTGMPLSTLFRFGAMTNGLQGQEPYRLLAACFVHMGILHVVMNMMALANLGRLIEPELKGPRLILAYVVTGIVGFAATIWWYGDRPYVTAGASGAIFGLEGLIVGSLAARRDPRWREMMKQIAVSSVILALVLPVNNSAHAGGFAAGLVLGAVSHKEARPWKVAGFVNVATILSLLAIVASLVLSQRSSVWKPIKRLEDDRAERSKRLQEGLPETIIEP